MVSPEEDNNKKGILLAVLVILAILSTVALNILIFSPPDSDPVQLGERSVKPLCGNLNVGPPVLGFTFHIFSTHPSVSRHLLTELGSLVTIYKIC